MKIITRNELKHPDKVELEDLEKQCFHDFFGRVDENLEKGMTLFEAKHEALALNRILYAGLDSYGNREFWGWLMVTERD